MADLMLAAALQSAEESAGRRRGRDGPGLDCGRKQSARVSGHPGLNAVLSAGQAQGLRGWSLLHSRILTRTCTGASCPAVTVTSPPGTASFVSLTCK